MSIETRFDVPLIARMASREKQIQQHYRPIIAVHKWFARRPGTLFRGLILAEFCDKPLAESFFAANDCSGPANTVRRRNRPPASLGVPSLPGAVQRSATSRPRTERAPHRRGRRRTDPARAGHQFFGPAALSEHALPLRNRGSEIPRHLFRARLSRRTRSLRIQHARHRDRHRSRCRIRGLEQHHRQVRKGEALLRGALRSRVQPWKKDDRARSRRMDRGAGRGPASSPHAHSVRRLRRSPTRGRQSRRGVHRPSLFRERPVRRAHGFLLRLASPSGGIGHGRFRGRVHALSRRADRKHDTGAEPGSFHGRHHVRLPLHGAGAEAGRAARLHLSLQHDGRLPRDRRRRPGQRTHLLGHAAVPDRNARLGPHPRDRIVHRGHRLRLPPTRFNPRRYAFRQTRRPFCNRRR